MSQCSARSFLMILLGTLITALAAQADDTGDRPRDIKSSLDDDDIAQTMQKQRSMLARCVTEQKHRQPSRSGTLLMKFTILPNGKTTRISVLTPELRDSSFAACVTRMISLATFPQHVEAGDPVEVPFKF